MTSDPLAYRAFQALHSELMANLRDMLMQGHSLDDESLQAHIHAIGETWAMILATRQRLLALEHAQTWQPDPATARGVYAQETQAHG